MRRNASFRSQGSASNSVSPDTALLTKINRYRRRRFLHVSVYLHNISKVDAAKITKLDTKMFHDESWGRIYFGVKRSKVKVTSHKNIADVGLCTLVSAGFF